MLLPVGGAAERCGASPASPSPSPSPSLVPWQAATFLAILLQGELGVRIGRGAGFPRRLHKGALFGERGMFNAGNIRAADVIALTDGYIATMLYSELELLGAAYPDLLKKFNLQMAKGALEEKLADTGMTIDDLEQLALERHINDLLALQASAKWREKHHELQDLREGLYAPPPPRHRPQEPRLPARDLAV